MNYKRLISVVLVCIHLLCLPAWAAISGGGAPAANSYSVKKVGEGIFAAIAQPKGKAASNAMFIVVNSQVILVGAHFVADGINELMDEIRKVTDARLTAVILTHHHRGYNYLDYDFPPDVEIISSWQTWQSLREGYRELKNPVTFFDKSITLRRGSVNIVASNVGRAHTDGDVVVYLPEQQVLFTSDLFYNGVIGFMGDGYMRDWIINTEMLEGLEASVVVPGLGNVTDNAGLRQFQNFFREFSTEILRHVEGKKTLEQTKKGFRLPKYESLPGYREFLNQNIERAYRQLKEQ